jgi:hypothetical protein
MEDLYRQVKSISLKEFKRKMSSFDKSEATKSDAADIKRIEKALFLAPGLLANEEFYITKSVSKCGRTLTFYDVVFTALKSGHTTSLIIHTLLGSKRFVQPPREVACSDCGELFYYREYERPHSYGCCSQ